MIRLASLLAMLAVASPALAEPVHQPYAGLETRPIKSLSPQEIADLRAGRGMGLALAAELNGYPGPLHVLEHASALALTADQKARTEASFAAMKLETMALGEQLIAAEAELDRLFATRTVAPETLRTATAAIGSTQARLRAAHLRYHLAMMDVLTAEQVRRYAELRGYAAADASVREGTGHHGHGHRGHRGSGG